VGDQLVNHNCIKSIQTSYFLNNNHLCWKSLFFSPFLDENHRYFLTWKKKVGVWWPIYFGAFCVELGKRKNSLEKLSLEMEISKPKSFGWNGTNINSLLVIHCYIMHSRYSLTPCKGLGVWKMRHPKIVETIKANLIQWKSHIKLPILALPKLYKEFTTHKNHRKPFLNTQYNYTLMHMHTHINCLLFWWLKGKMYWKSSSFLLEIRVQAFVMFIWLVRMELENQRNGSLCNLGNGRCDNFIWDYHGWDLL